MGMLLNRMVRNTSWRRGHLSRHRKNKRVSQVYTWAKSITAEGTAYAYGPEAGVCLACSRTSEEASVAGRASPRLCCLGLYSLLQAHLHGPLWSQPSHNWRLACLPPTLTCCGFPEGHEWPGCICSPCPHALLVPMRVGCSPVTGALALESDWLDMNLSSAVSYFGKPGQIDLCDSASSNGK